MRSQKIILGFLLSFLCQKGVCQTFDWAVRAGSDDYDQITNMVQDDYGNIYTIGQVGANAQFGNITLTNGGALFAKIDSSGNFLFARTFNGLFSRRIAINRKNQILISGQYTGNNFDGTPVSNPSGSLYTGIAALYDSSGTQLWLTVFDLLGPTAVDVYDDVNFVVGGTLPPNGMVGSYNFSNTTESTFYSIIDSSGSIIDAQLVANNSNEFEIAASNSGQFYIRGEYNQSTTLSNGQTLISPNNGFGEFLVKVNSNGNIVWALNEYDTTPSLGGGFSSSTMKLDGNENLILYTLFTDTAYIGMDTITAPIQGSHSFLSSIDSSGAVNWINVYENDAFCTIYVVDSNGFYVGFNPMQPILNLGNLILSPLAGHFGIYLVRYDLNGVPQWSKTIQSHHLGGFCCESIQGVTSYNNDIFISGFYYDETLFDSYTLNCFLMPTLFCSVYELFIAKLSNIPVVNAFPDSIENQLSFYPNPTDGILNVRFTNELISDIDFKITDATGRILLSGIFSDSNAVLHLDHLSPGIYAILLFSDGEFYSEKIIRTSR